MLRNQHVCFGARLRQLYLQALEGALQRLDLHLLIGYLLIEVLCHLLKTQDTLERCPGQFVILFCHGQLCLAHPFAMLLGILFFLFLQQMQISQRDCHLRLDLQELVLHVENDLLQHLLGILSLVDQIIQVCSYQRRNTIQ